MESISDNRSKENRVLFDKAMLNVISYLESLDDVSSVDFQVRGSPCSNADVAAWERKNMPYKLPNDMKALFTLFNGFSLKWKIMLGSDSNEIGYLSLNKLESIVRVPIEGQLVPHFNHANMHDINIAHSSKSSMTPYALPDPTTSAAFVIDSHPVHGQIVLFYSSKLPTSSSVILNNAQSQSALTSGYENPEIWLQDTSGRWHFITSNISQYLRLLIMHLGIMGWIMVYTPEGVSPATFQWMSLYCKERLVLDLYWNKKQQQCKELQHAVTTSHPNK